MYVKSVIINAANIMTSEKEKFIRYTSFLEEPHPLKVCCTSKLYHRSLQSCRLFSTLNGNKLTILVIFNKKS
jgi:hypothetical protein